MPSGALSSLPLKITSSMCWPRNTRIFCSPRTHLMASAILLLPQPLGPTMADMPGSSLRVVFRANDLKPKRSSCLKYINRLSRKRLRRKKPGCAAKKGASAATKQDSM